MHVPNLHAEYKKTRQNGFYVRQKIPFVMFLGLNVMGNKKEIRGNFS